MIYLISNALQILIIYKIAVIKLCWCIISDCWIYVTTTKICVNWWKKKSTCSLEFDTQLQCIYQRQLGKKGEKLKEILNIIFSYFALIWHNINNHNIDEKKPQIHLSTTAIIHITEHCVDEHDRYTHWKKTIDVLIIF